MVLQVQSTLRDRDVETGRQGQGEEKAQREEEFRL